MNQPSRSPGFSSCAPFLFATSVLAGLPSSSAAQVQVVVTVKGNVAQANISLVSGNDTYSATAPSPVPPASPVRRLGQNAAPAALRNGFPTGWPKRGRAAGATDGR